MTTSTAVLSEADQAFLDEVMAAFTQSNKEFARAYYLFATARLEKTFNSAEIYARYPILQDENTFKRLKPLYDNTPENEEVKRLFIDAFNTYVANTFSRESDELTNRKNQLQIDLTGLGFVDKSGNPMNSVLFEDTPELFKKTPEREKRRQLFERVNETYEIEISPLFIALFHKENDLFAQLGYPDIIKFYTQSSGHPLTQLGKKAQQVITETDEDYHPLMADFYQRHTNESFDKGAQYDISYVFHGKSPDLNTIHPKFSQSRLVKLARQTFDGMGLAFSDIAQTVDYASKEAYLADVDNPNRSSRILLDVSQREGKRSRAYVYPAQTPNEIYLSVKPEGGLYDYSAFFHESGHANHFAYVRKDLSFPLALMGNNTVTESYAYLFQNLFLNLHWLVNAAGLTEAEAKTVIRRGALNDLFMLRRYGSKMQFELKLFNGTSVDGKDKAYADLLSQGTGFQYFPVSWTRDVDHGFYVADYFTAWALEAQLREYLQNHYGNREAFGEDWYQNPEAGKFMINLWKDGNLKQVELSERLGYNNPEDFSPLLRLMKLNLKR